MVLGGTGTIGKAVVAALSAGHEVVAVGHSRGEHTVDIASAGSLRKLLDEVGTVDAIVSCTGQAAFGALESLSDDDFQLGLGSKLMGQVNVVRLGLAKLRDGGSITLTSGVLAREPIPGSAAISLVNAGLEGFVRAAALEAPRGIRVNVVSPPWVSETLAAMGRDPTGGLPAATVARSYVEAVEGSRNGTVIDPRG